MSLSDPKFLLFLLPIVALFYALSPGFARRALLLVASYAFYFNLSGYYIFVLLFVTCVAYAGGVMLRRVEFKTRRNLFFALICAIILAPLIVFKYLGFLLAAGAIAAKVMGVPIAIANPGVLLLLPIGISFFTFAALGYLIDIYLDVLDPEHDPIRIALFLSLFPIVTAGPIERGGSLLPQLELNHRFSSEVAFAGLRLIFVGLVLKVVIADTLIVPVNALFAEPQKFAPIEKLLSMIFCMFYIYTDFAGYSLIAIGSAHLFGLEIRPNFRQPFLSPTVPDFWRNWHISLSSWVRDYLFTPLRVRWRAAGDGGFVAAIILSFAILGIWHGAGTRFLVFGVIHGLLVIASTYTLTRRDALWDSMGVPRGFVHASRIVATFFVVLLTVVFYRANSMSAAWTILKDILSLIVPNNLWHGLRLAFSPAEHSGLTIVKDHWAGWGLIGLVIVGDLLVRRKVTLGRFPRGVQMVLYNVGALAILYQWVFANLPEPFLYYRF